MYLSEGDILLRGIEEEDNSLLLELINNPIIEQMVGGKSFPLSKYDQLNWYYNNRKNDGSVRFIITYQKVPVGTIILSDLDYINGNCEVHIKLLPEYHGKGIGKSSLYMVVNYVFFELRMEAIYANILSNNLNSLKLFEKIGFKIDGRLRSRVYKNGQLLDLINLSILKDEFNLK